MLTEHRNVSLKEAKRDAAQAALVALGIDEPPVTKPSASTPAPADSVPPQGLTLNLIDCPGHVDFSGEVTAALRISDGAMVVVDAVDGVGVQTETVLRQALAEYVRPVLFVNKVDRLLGELQCEPEEAYQRLEKAVAEVNAVIELYQPDGVDFTVDPARGNVAFGSGLYGWGFTLPGFARQLVTHQARAKARQQKKDGEPPSPEQLEKQTRRMTQRLWGPSYHDRVAGKWQTDPVPRSGKTAGAGVLDRAFCSYVLQPIYEVHRAQAENRVADMRRMAERLGVDAIRPADWEAEPAKELRKRLLRHWLPVADAMLHIINHHLPSPLEAQPYRAPHLYEGNASDEACLAMQHCDPEAPAIFYVSKMVPSPVKGSKGMIAYGRLFCGRLHSGSTLHLLGADHVPADLAQVDDSDDGAGAGAPAAGPAPAKATVRGLVEVNAARVAALTEVGPGAVCGIMGMEQAVLKSGTLAEAPSRTYPLKTLKFSVSPVVRVAVRTKRPGDAQKLAPAMRRLQQSDPCAQCFVDEQTGERIVAGVGELHVEVCVHALAELAGCEVVAAEPVVQYSEAATAVGDVGLAKSANKHNRLFVSAAPLPAASLEAALERGDISMAQSPVERGRLLADVHGLDRGLARKLTAIEGTCLLVDGTVGIDISPIRDMVTLAFREFVSAGGVLAREPVRTTCFTITDAKLHADGVHRRADQIMPMARRALSGAFLLAAPRLLEPIFAVEIQLPDVALGAMRTVLKARRGAITQDLPVFGTPLHVVSATLPVAQSFGFNGDLMGATSGKAFPTLSFSRWELLEGDPCDAATETGQLVQDIRQRKRMPKVEVPAADSLLDRL
jgi:elongation factor 2